jgi:hypothetical protein
VSAMCARTCVLRAPVVVLLCQQTRCRNGFEVPGAPQRLLPPPQCR